MRNIMIVSTFLTLLSCKTNEQKFRISPIYAEPKKITSDVSENGVSHKFNTFKEIIERLNPLIFMISKEENLLKFRLQGNISSSSHYINHIQKIRIEEELTGNTLRLKYIVEIKRIAGKENSNIRGYNYTKDETYKIPAGAKIITIELYENFVNKSSDAKPRLTAQQSFNFFTHM